MANPSAVEPIVSVCVGVYNQAEYISDSLLSVLGQSFEGPVEILVGNDCSTDTTADILAALLERHPGQVTIFNHEVNLGPTKNYQFLVERARGRYIAYLDGDDYWLPGKVADQVGFLEAHPHCAAVYGNAVVVTPDGKPVGFFNNPQPETMSLDRLVEKGNFLNSSSTMFRAIFKEAILGLDEEIVDYMVHIQMAKRGDLGYLNRVLTVYRSGVGTSMVRLAPEKVRGMIWNALLASRCGLHSEKSWNTAVEKHLGEAWAFALGKQDIRLARGWWTKATSAYPGHLLYLWIAASLGCFRILGGRLAQKAKLYGKTFIPLVVHPR